MGKRNRERIARILAGKESALSARVKETMVSAGVSTVEKYSVDKQIQFLADALHEGRLSPNKLRRELERNAPLEMRKGADKLIKQGRAINVDALLMEYRSSEGFQELATEVGLNQQWFTELAKQECQRRGVN